ncbi:response regulator [Azospirillum sp. SYSU D00513]|uniref:response regulator n=1 Tax=Azospirillum sp. SYSU D00513 TaxID=2812561 RepID=UPI001A96A4C9
MESAKVLIADDHPLFREALRQVVDSAFSACSYHEAKNLPDALSMATGGDFDLILLDLRMPGMNGFTGLVTMRNEVPATPIVVVSADEEPDSIHEAITFGASGFIPKSLSKEQMVQAVRNVLQGDVFLPFDHLESQGQTALDDGDFGSRIAQLTAQQRKVLEMLVRGKSNKVIAFELDLAESTVKAHVSAVLRKLNVTSRTQAVINAGKITPKLVELRA